MDSRTRKQKNGKKRKWIYWVGGIFLALFLAIGGFALYVWNELGNTVETMHTPLERDDERVKETEERFKERDTVNALLLGIDQKSGGGGRSDTIILLSLNPNTDSMIMMSIPRDTYVNIPGRGMDKINHAHAFGGAELSVQTVEETFDIPIHVYGRINMDGFQQGIDALGGVTVHNSLAFSQGGNHFPEGEIHLSGSEALDFIRMRKNDPRGDFGRNDRQRQVIAAAIDKAANFSSITKFGEILDIVGSNVQTDLDMKRIQNLFSNYLGTRKNIETLQIDGNGQMIGGIYYYVVPDTEFSRLSTEINDHMEAR